MRGALEIVVAASFMAQGKRRLLCLAHKLETRVDSRHAKAVSFRRLTDEKHMSNVKLL